MGSMGPILIELGSLKKYVAKWRRVGQCFVVWGKCWAVLENVEKFLIEFIVEFPVEWDSVG